MLGALGRDRDLVDVEVELLGARRVGGVEGDDDPFHLVLGEPELLGHRVGDGALEALAVGGLVVLEVGRIGGLIGPDRQRAGVLQGEARLGARRRCRLLGGGRRRGAGARAVVAAAARGDGEGQRHERADEERAHAPNLTEPLGRPARAPILGPMSTIDEAGAVPRERLAALSLEQKVRLLTGADFWSLHAEPAVGLRRARDLRRPGRRARRALGRARARRPTCPSPTALAATWDEARIERLGRLLAAECRRKGVDVLLAPTVNLHRTPLRRPRTSSASARTRC